MRSCGQGGGQNLRRRTGRPARGVPPPALPPPERRCPEPGRTKTGAAERYRPRPGYRPRSPLLPARKPSLPTRPPKAKPPPRSRSSVAPSHSPPAQGDHPTSILAGCGLWGQEAPQVVDNFGASVDWRGGPVSTLADRPAGGELDRASPATHRGRSGEAVGGLRTWGASCSSARVTSGGEPGATGCRALGRTTASAVAGHSGEPGPGGSRVLGCTAPSAAAVQWRAVTQRVSGPGVAPCLLQRRPGPSRCLDLGAAFSGGQVRRRAGLRWSWAMPSAAARCSGAQRVPRSPVPSVVSSAARRGGEPPVAGTSRPRAARCSLARSLLGRRSWPGATWCSLATVAGGCRMAPGMPRVALDSSARTQRSRSREDRGCSRRTEARLVAAAGTARRYPARQCPRGQRDIRPPRKGPANSPSTYPGPLDMSGEVEGLSYAARTAAATSPATPCREPRLRPGPRQVRSPW
jgi:hypothetical protein